MLENISAKPPLLNGRKVSENLHTHIESPIIEQPERA